MWKSSPAAPRSPPAAIWYLRSSLISSPLGMSIPMTRRSPRNWASRKTLSPLPSKSRPRVVASRRRPTGFSGPRPTRSWSAGVDRKCHMKSLKGGPSPLYPSSRQVTPHWAKPPSQCGPFSRPATPSTAWPPHRGLPGRVKSRNSAGSTTASRSPLTSCRSRISPEPQQRTHPTSLTLTAASSAGSEAGRRRRISLQTMCTSMPLA